jgi:hypothetical protein
VYTVLTKSGKKAYNFSDKKSADHYAKQINGKVVNASVLKCRSLQRNPTEYFGKREDTYEARLYRLDQYSSQPSYVWWREVIQNAVDAGATNVICEVYEIDGGINVGKQLVCFRDNGKGMTKEKLKEKFLTEGGTDKGKRDEDTGNLGGFGEAKKIILLAWRSWRVITSTGQTATIADCPKGGDLDYECDQVNANTLPHYLSSSNGYKGTSVEVVTWAGKSNHRIFVEHAKGLVDKCNLPNISFTFRKYDLDSLDNTSFESVRIAKRSAKKTNESVVIPKLEFGRDKKIFKDSNGRELAKAYFRKNPSKSSPSYAYYRVKGLYLYEHSLEHGVHGTVIIEFLVETTKILSDNRDSIKHEILRKSIHEWIIALNKDPDTELRSIGGKQTKITRGFGSLSAPVRREHKEAQARLMDLACQDSGIGKQQEISKQAAEQIDRILNEEHPDSPIMSLPGNLIKKMIEFDVKISSSTNSNIENLAGGKLALKDAVQRMMHIPDYCIRVEDDYEEADFKVPAAYNPKTMTQEVKKLLSVWAEACRLVMMMKGYSGEYGVGFVFSDDCVALAGKFKDEENGVYDAQNFLLIKPFGKSKNNILNINDINTLKTIWVSAIHEVTHIADNCMSHSKEFWDMVQINFAICSAAFPLFNEIAKAASVVGKVESQKFAESIDLNEYEEASKQGIRPRTRNEKQLEKQLCASIVASVKAGNDPPPIDKTELSKMLTDKSKSEIALAVKYKSSSSTVSSFDQETHKMVIDSLRAKLRIADEINNTLSQNNTTLSQRNASLSQEVETLANEVKSAKSSPVQPSDKDSQPSNKLFRLISISEISKKYKN